MASELRNPEITDPEMPEIKMAEMNDPELHEPRIKPIDAEALVNLLLPGGALHSLKSDFETRDAQLEMLEEVVKCFNSDQVVVVEAGTGVGKSLAYLIPAIAWVLQNNERVVISTSTINLQEQIFTKDLPLVQSLFSNSSADVYAKDSVSGSAQLGSDIRVAIAKGRGNYLCAERLNEARAEFDLFEGEAWQKLIDWAESTQTGDKSEIPFKPSPSLWQRVQSDPDFCPDARCQHKGQCFFQKARRGMAEAQIIITNHSLLCTDLAIRSEGYDQDSSIILPAFQRLIIDEAHNIESVARGCFSEELNRFHIHKYLGNLNRSTGGSLGKNENAATNQTSAQAGGKTATKQQTAKKPQSAKSQPAKSGLIAYFREQYTAQFPNIEEKLEKIASAYNDLEAKILPYFIEQQSIRLVASESEAEGENESLRESKVEGEFGEGEAETDTGRTNNGKKTNTGANPFEKALFSGLDDLKSAVQECKDILKKEYNRLEEQSVDDARMAELRTMIHRLGSVAGLCSEFKEFHTRPDRVFWIEKLSSGGVSRRSEGYVNFKVAPIEVSAILKEALFSVFSGIVLTSATLSVAGTCAGWQERIGLADSERLSSTILGSPFNYSERVLLAVPTDAPDPSGSSQSYTEWLKEFLLRTLAVSEGHALVLFTSYVMLNAVYAHCKDALSEMGIACLSQSEGNRNALLEEFRHNSSSVLMATHSFWEGVDAPGDTLRLLIICKLPFKVPTDPLLLAQSEAIRQRGGNPFVEMSIPDAVIKLKQGFGRLMRRKTDSGAVIICDKRIISKPYGRIFRESLPPAQFCAKASSELITALESHLYN